MEASLKRTIPDQITVADYVIHSKHMNRHDRPYRCQRTECAQLEGFTYSGGLLRHQREVHGLHGGPKEQMRCTVSTCKRHSGKGFTRKENLNEHLRRVHGITTADVVTPSGHQDFPSSTNVASSVGNRDAESDPQHVIERQNTRDNAHLANQIRTPAPTEQTSASSNRMLPGPHQYPRPPARGNANLAVQTRSVPPRRRRLSTPAIRVTTERPHTPDAQWQPEDSHNTSETSLYAPYTYVHTPYIGHENQFYAGARFNTMSTDVQFQGPPPQLGQVGQMAPQGGIASPISDNPVPPSPQVSHLIQMRPHCGSASPIEMVSPFSRPSLPSSVTSTGVTQQTGRKRSHGDAFPRSPGQTAISECPMRPLKVRELSTRAMEHLVDSNNDGKSIENLSGVQALLLRWFEAGAAALVLSPSDG